LAGLPGLGGRQRLHDHRVVVELGQQDRPACRRCRRPPQRARRGLVDGRGQRRVLPVQEEGRWRVVQQRSDLDASQWAL
jgi:hypothetical protein